MVQALKDMIISQLNFISRQAKTSNVTEMDFTLQFTTPTLHVILHGSFYFALSFHVKAIHLR